MFERFTDPARELVVLAQDEARRFDHHFVGTEHLLLGLLAAEGSGAAEVLASLGVTLDAARDHVEEIVGRGDLPTTGNLAFTPRSKKVLELALREALQLGDDDVGTEHVLLGIIREGEGVATEILVRLGAGPDRTRMAVTARLAGERTVETEPTGAATPPRPRAPLCPRCGSSLAERTPRLIPVEVQPEGDEPPVVLRTVTCAICAAALGWLPPS